MTGTPAAPKAGYNGKPLPAASLSLFVRLSAYTVVALVPVLVAAGVVAHHSQWERLDEQADDDTKVLSTILTGLVGYLIWHASFFQLLVFPVSLKQNALLHAAVFGVALASVTSVQLSIPTAPQAPAKVTTDHGFCEYIPPGSAAAVATRCPLVRGFVRLPWNSLPSERQCPSGRSSFMADALTNFTEEDFAVLHNFATNVGPAVFPLVFPDFPAPAAVECARALGDLTCFIFMPPCDSNCLPLRACSSVCRTVQSTCGALGTYDVVKRILPDGDQRTLMLSVAVLSPKQVSLLDMVLLALLHCATQQPGDTSAFTCTTTPERTADCVFPTASDYRGNVSVTSTGIPCQKWTAQSPHIHDRTPLDYPGAGLGDHNYCRNPDGEECAWCYTNNSLIRDSCCNITCDVSQFLYGPTLQNSTPVYRFINDTGADWSANPEEACAFRGMPVDARPGPPNGSCGVFVNATQENANRQAAYDDQLVKYNHDRTRRGGVAVGMAFAAVVVMWLLLTYKALVLQSQFASVFVQHSRDASLYFARVAFDNLFMATLALSVSVVLYVLGWTNTGASGWTVVFQVLSLAGITVVCVWLCHIDFMRPLVHSKKESSAQTGCFDTAAARCSYAAVAAFHRARRLYSTYFGFSGRYYEPRQAMGEMVEVSIQFANMFSIMDNTDSWTVLVYVVALSLNLTVTPLLWRSERVFYRRNVALVFDTVIDTFFFIFNIILRPDRDINTQFAVVVLLPSVLLFNRCWTLSSHLVRVRTALIVAELQLESKVSVRAFSRRSISSAIASRRGGAAGAVRVRRSQAPPQSQETEEPDDAIEEQDDEQEQDEQEEEEEEDPLARVTSAVAFDGSDSAGDLDPAGTDQETSLTKGGGMLVADLGSHAIAGRGFGTSSLSDLHQGQVQIELMPVSSSANPTHDQRLDVPGPAQPPRLHRASAWQHSIFNPASLLAFQDSVASGRENDASEDRAVASASHEPHGRVRGESVGVKITHPVLRRVVDALVAVLVSCAVLLLVSYVSRMAVQQSRCERLVGQTLWDATSPKIYFPRGFFADADCDFSLVTGLDISARELTEVDADAIGHYAALDSLNVSHNRLSTVPLTLGASHMPGLRTLDLSHNEIALISPVLFQQWQLTTLRLEGNPFATQVDYSNQKLSTLPPLFDRVLGASVQHLNLTNNSLHTLEPFQTYQSLDTLELDGNRVSAFPESSTFTLSTLRVLKLRRNGLSWLPSLLDIRRWKRLMQLDFRHNSLTFLPTWLVSFNGSLALADNGEILTLSVRSRNIDFLNPAIGDMRVGRSLDVSFNRLRHVPAELGQLTQIIEFDARRNLLSDVPSQLAGMRGLEAMYLEQNTLTGIPRELFALPRLGFLQLCHNKLSALPPPPVEGNATLLFMRLCNNNFNVIPPLVPYLTRQGRLQSVMLVGQPVNSSSLEDFSGEQVAIQPPNPWGSYPLDAAARVANWTVELGLPCHAWFGAVLCGFAECSQPRTPVSGLSATLINVTITKNQSKGTIYPTDYRAGVSNMPCISRFHFRAPANRTIEVPVRVCCRSGSSVCGPPPQHRYICLTVASTCT